MLHSFLVLHPALAAQIEQILVTYNQLGQAEREALQGLAHQLLNEQKGQEIIVRVLGSAPASPQESANLLEPSEEAERPDAEGYTIQDILLLEAIKQAWGLEQDPSDIMYWLRGERDSG